LLRPLLKSLKLVASDGFSRGTSNPETFKRLVRTAIRIYNDDIVQDDHEALVALINLTLDCKDRSLRFELGNTIGGTVMKHVELQPRLLVSSRPKSAYILSVYNSLLIK
jgi:hypothetical protein